MNIVLTGFMATGKSSIGKKLAEKLGFSFIDTDEAIEKDIGLPISEIFKRQGEVYFRDAETKVIKCVSLLDNFVIATGGGAVTREENIVELEKNGIIVNLKAGVETILERTKKDLTRPLIQVKEPREEIEKLLKIREPFYKRCKFSVDTSKTTVDEAVDKVTNFLSKYHGTKNKNS